VGEAKRRYFAENGVRRTLITDADTPDRFYVHTEQDVEPVLDSIARDSEIMANNGDMRLEGRLPLIVVEDLIHRHIYFDQDAFNRWWRSSEADPWRIWRWRH
jgi:hypothetical protein